jgi:tetratricopeptide (TPR) repeat protein
MFPRLMAALKRTWRPDAAQAQAGRAAALQQAHRLFDAGDYAAARAAYDSLIAAKGSPELLVNRGYCELQLGQSGKSRDSFRAALARAPQLAQAWVGLGDIAAQHNAHDEALHCYDNALQLDAGLLIARNNRAQSLIALGRLEQAWQDAETRFDLPHAATLYPHRLALPRWDGRPGARVLVHWEQGFGDIIQHLRFLPQAAIRTGEAGTLAFECPPPLAELVRRMPGAPALIVAGNAAPALAGFDCQAPLLSLPYLLGAKSGNLPPAPYVRADAARAATLRAAWTKKGVHHLTGIAWRASAFDVRRSLPLTALLDAFAGLSDTRLVSLQKDSSEAERALLAQAGAVDAGRAFETFDDTAAALAAVNAVVCVDTAVAHLGGALGRPTLLLLNEPAAVRWMTRREDSPWYASLRLLRKAADEDWRALLVRAAAALPRPPVS